MLLPRRPGIVSLSRSSRHPCRCPAERRDPEARWLAWGESVVRGRGRRACSSRSASRTSRCTRAWHEVEDGVLWSARAEGVTAARGRAGSAGGGAGIERGDVLLAVNGAPVQTPADVVEYPASQPRRARASPTRCCASGRARRSTSSLAPAPRGSSMYFVLAAVGLFTLLVGASVRLRRPRDQATLHFFWLCVAFFGVVHLLVQRTVRSARLGVLLGRRGRVGAAAAAAAALHAGVPGASDAWRRGDRAARSLVVPLMYLPALRARRRRASSPSRAGRAAACTAPLFSRAIDAARSRRADLPVRLRRGGARRAGPRVPARSRRSPAGVNCAGSRGARRWASGRSRSATRCRGRSASIRRSRCS